MRYMLLVILALGQIAGPIGCVSQPDKQGNAIIHRDALSLETKGVTEPEVQRIKLISEAKLEAHGNPEIAVLPVHAPEEKKNEEAEETATSIKEQASILKQLLGKWWPYVIGAGGVLSVLGGIGLKIYTGNWAGVLKDIGRATTMAIEKFGNKQQKEFVAKQLKGKMAGKLIDKLVVEAENSVNGADSST